MSIITEAVIVDSLVIPQEQCGALKLARWCEVLPSHLRLERGWVCIWQSENLPKPRHLEALSPNQIFATHWEVIPSHGNCHKLLTWSSVTIGSDFKYYLIGLSCPPEDKVTYEWNSPGLPLATKSAWAGHGSNVDALGFERAIALWHAKSSVSACLSQAKPPSWSCRKQQVLQSACASSQAWKVSQTYCDTATNCFRWTCLQERAPFLLQNMAFSMRPQRQVHKTTQETTKQVPHLPKWFCGFIFPDPLNRSSVCSE